MQCQQCKQSWPDGTKFCGACGARLDAAAGLGSAAAMEVNKRLTEFLPRLGLGQFQEVRPGIHLGQKGSTFVEVRVVAMGPLVAVRSQSPVTVETPITQDLLLFLLKENASLLFGGFGIGPRNEVLYHHTIMATSMDLHELGSSVTAVINTADKYDDQIAQRWGGKTAGHSAVEQVIAPAIVGALLGRGPARPQAAAPTRPPQAATPDQMLRTMRKPQAIKVSSIQAEYDYLEQQRCTCGGKYNLDARALLEINGQMFDQMNVSCVTCGSEMQFLFDINSFFGKR